VAGGAVVAIVTVVVVELDVVGLDVVELDVVGGTVVVTVVVVVDDVSPSNTATLASRSATPPEVQAERTNTKTPSSGARLLIRFLPLSSAPVPIGV
jgi:hypothetical protein